MSFAYHVGGDIIHNGVKITSEIKNAVSDYNQQKWYDFGLEAGEASAHVFLGSTKEYLALAAEDPEKEKQALFFQGFFNAFGYKFDLYQLLVCINQEDQAALFLDVAYQAFEKALHDTTTSDMIGDLVGTAIGVFGAYQQFEKGLPYCENIVQSDLTRVQTAMDVLSNPFENMPRMTSNLKKYEAELKDDVLSAGFLLKTEQYEKFGEQIGLLVKVITEKEQKQGWTDVFPKDNRLPIAEFLQGFFKSTNVGQFDITNLLVCIYEMDDAALAFYQGAEMLDEAWNKKDWQEAVGGAIAIVAGVQGVQQGLPVCEAVDTKSKNWKDLNRLIDIAQNKKTAFKIIGENMIYNGVSITSDMLAAVESYENKDYRDFGYMFGDAMMTASQENLFLY